ncbi:MAG TPA: hypothetical protein VKE41_20170 [Roseiflexaceae bacterium]|nr:hypothetical protein [Roseiflexaceae bacterium]
MDVAELLASVPTPSAEDMLRRREWARHYTLVFLRKGPAPRTDEARNEQLQLEHLQHLAKLQLLGKLMLCASQRTQHRAMYREHRPVL